MDWYYLDSGQQRGPVSETDFSSLVQQGVIRADTQLWCEGMAEWKSYESLLAPAAPAPAAAATAELGRAGLRVREAEASPQGTHDVACSRCGAIVPLSQTRTLGNQTLCAACLSGSAPVLQEREYADPFVRLGCFLLDGLICGLGTAAFTLVVRLIVYYGFAPAAGQKPDPNNRYVLLAILVVYIGAVLWWTLDYFVGRIARDGATPAMKWAGIRVVTLTGQRLSGLHALGRYLMLGLVSMFTCHLGHIAAFVSKKKQSLHDMVCGTVVIKG
jgi:uncharacterized RDD family membrane protein YckC